MQTYRAGGGLKKIEDDLTPKLGGHLDGSNKDLTNVNSINPALIKMTSGDTFLDLSTTYASISKNVMPSSNRSRYLGQPGLEFKMVSAQLVQGEDYLKDGGYFAPETVTLKTASQVLTAGQWYLLKNVGGSIQFIASSNDSEMTNWTDSPIWFDFNQNKLRQLTQCFFYVFVSNAANWDWTVNHYNNAGDITQSKLTGMVKTNGSYYFSNEIYMVKQDSQYLRSMTMFIKPSANQTVHAGVLQFNVL